MVVITLAKQVRDLQGRISQRRACRLADLSLSTWQYKEHGGERAGLRSRLKGLAYERRRFDYRRLHALPRCEG